MSKKQSKTKTYYTVYNPDDSGNDFMSYLINGTCIYESAKEAQDAIDDSLICEDETLNLRIMKIEITPGKLSTKNIKNENILWENREEI